MRLEYECATALPKPEPALRQARRPNQAWCTMSAKPFVTPFLLPVVSFAAAIFVGAVLLSTQFCALGDPVPFVDAFFIATSCVCVTGLASVDPSTVFNMAGRWVMLALIQLGGLGIVTYSTLILYMFSRRISLWDRLAVGRALLQDQSFHLGTFLQRMALIVFGIEAAGALFLYCMEPERIGLFNAVFLAVSGFCNAGFAFWPDNLMQWRSHWGVNMTIMGLITCGGLGFFVLDEILRVCRGRLGRFRQNGRRNFLHPPLPRSRPPRLSYYTRLVLWTSAGLAFFGALAIFLADLGNEAWRGMPWSDRALAALFQSVTSRTAGFATMDMALFSDLSLLITIVLMVIGGSPGSCAGGVKTSTFRVLCAYVAAQLKGHRQVVVRGRAVATAVLNKVMLLFYFAMLTMVAATLLLTMTENGAAHHGGASVQIMDIFFEVVSAFGTVGLSINLTPRLSEAGKVILCLVMFIGRLGPIWLVTTIQQFQSEPAFRYPETDLPIG